MTRKPAVWPSESLVHIGQGKLAEQEWMGGLRSILHSAGWVGNRAQSWKASGFSVAQIDDDFAEHLLASIRGTQHRRTGSIKK
jgi:hypothetical protein